ncbi:MAG: ribosome small subunit-dependent GTPase A [Gemmatimonadales bacterium]
MGSLEVVRGRVLRSVGGVYSVELDDGGLVDCAVRGRLKRQKVIGKVAVGDAVEIERTPEGTGVIKSLLPRSSRLSRRSADGRREQIIAANVDQLAAVFSVRQPEPVFELIDRFLVLAEESDIGAFIVVNKTDLAVETATASAFAEYERVGYPVLFTSAKTRRNLGQLGERLGRRVTLFVGPSGTGKSSLLNALQPGLGLRIGEISKAIQRGRHTTVSASLHRLDIGGYVVDTPGLGKLKFWEVGEHDLAWCFPDFRALVGHCRFPDCQHTHEPDCAVAEAVEEGKLSARRYESYRKLIAEAQSDQR